MEVTRLLSQLRVLYLEDDEAVRKNVTVSLSYLVKEVIGASRAQEALDAFEKHRPDMIISDIDMPGMNGLEFIKSIRESDQFIPVIILTAYKTENFLLEALNLHIDRYIIKPITLDQMISAITESAQRLLELDRFEIDFPSGYRYNVHKQTFITPSGKTERLVKKEKLLFELLVRNKSNLTSYDMIEEEVWDHEIINMGSLKVLVNKLRHKTGKEAIVNEPESGYRLLL